VLAQHTDHAAIFEFVEAPLRRRKYEHRRAGMAKDEQFHIPPERRAEPPMIVTLHAMMLLQAQMSLQNDAALHVTWRCRALL
jgi:UDP-galactopyranose mutase